MFGFLKKKLKDAVNKFTKKAAEEVVEEKVEDQEAIQRAKAEEEALLKREVTKIPETPKEKAQHEKEKAEKKKAVKKEPATKPPAPEPAKKTPAKKEARKPTRAPETKPEKPTKASQKPESATATPATTKAKKELEEPALQEPEPTPEPATTEAAPVKQAEKEQKRGFLKKLFTKKEPEEKREPPVEKTEKPAPEPVTPEKEPAITEPTKQEPAPQEPAPPEPETPKRGLFAKLKESFTKKSLSEEKFEELFWDLEVALLENNVAVEVIEKIKDDLKRELTSGKVTRLGIDDLILVSLKRSIEEILSVPGFDLVQTIKDSHKRPYVITFIGVNGSGKTTTLAKIANKFQEEGLSVVIAASDTFRAAAIDQLGEHAHKLGIKMISQGYGADPAAVAYDAIEHAKAKAIDVVMIDTAGRLHSNTNLMAELEKVVRVAKPDLKIFIGESTTGNDCVEQAKTFDELVGIDAIILSKADVDEKGGAALSVSYVTGKPILYLGVGQAYGDLKAFDKEEIIRNLGL